MTIKPSLIVVSLLLASPHTLLRADESPVLQAGAAVANISPQTLPALMNGGFLENRANRVVDPLHARALVLSDGSETVAIAIVDSCMFPTALCDEIKRITSKRTGIATNRILISATHTHTAPAAMSCLGCAADEAYVKLVPARVAQAIVDAHKNSQPAKVGWAIVNAPELTNCRRWITRSDRMGTDPFGQRTVRAMMHPGYQNPDYTSPAGAIDPWLSVLSVVSARDDAPICLLANLSMHYFGGGGFSADYYGEVARRLETEFKERAATQGAPFVGIMSQGTSGDLHWMDYSKPRRNVSRQQYSQDVASRILQATKTIQYRSDQSLAMAEERLSIDRRLPSRERREWARPINTARGERPPRNQVEVYAEQAEWIHQHPTAEVVLQAVRIGDLGITAIPNEVYGITGLKLKRRSPLRGTFNLELANGATGYIPPPEQHRLGGYTTWPARTAGLVEQAEPLIVETLLGLLETVADNHRRAIAPAALPYSEAVSTRKPLAYWRLEDMDASRVEDATGEHHARYHDGVALFLPGPNGSGFAPETPESSSPSNALDTHSFYANRSVYLAGGYIEASLEQLPPQFSVSMWFANSLPSEARDTTGVLLATDSSSLEIAGKAAGQGAGKLRLTIDQESFEGSTQIATRHWHHVMIVRDQKRVRVYLDGDAKPEIDEAVAGPEPSTRLLLGSDGNAKSTFDGKIDEVAVFGRALPVADVTALYETSGMTPPPRPKPVMFLAPKPADATSRRRYGEAILESKPIAFWRLHDESSRRAKDSAGQHPASYEEGALPLQAEAAKPNFSGGRVKAQLAKLGDAYSVELWFRNDLPVDSRPVTAYLFSRSADGVDGASGDNLGIGGTHSNRGRLIVFNGNTRNELVAGQTPLPPGGWSHVVMVRQGKRITVYLNGDPNPEIVADLPAAYPAENADILLGGRGDNFANLQGRLEEAAVYDRALKPGEVKAHFDAAGVKTAKKTTSLRPAEPTPTDVGKALETIHIRKGFEVQLVAAEPLVMDPVAIDWGPDGRLWVVEMADYPSGVDGRGKPGGRVRFLEDTNSDGEYDKSTLFADGLSFPNGVLSWGRGILITAAPQIIYLEDSTGDGKADIRRPLYSGFLEGNQQLRVNGLRPGLDNWVYCASGSHHAGYGKDSQITSHLAGQRFQIGSRDFRIQPATGAIDPQSGPSQYGRNRDDWGNWFGVQNSHPLWHYVLDDHNIRRNLHFAPPNPKHQVITPANPRVFPVSQRQKRFHSFSQSGRFTSACSAMVYRDQLLFVRGAEQHAFTCEPFHNLVQHNLIADDGVSFRFRRDPDEAAADFFASTDRWCRPVMARTGPDGALWIVDMYRYMIEHPQWLPQDGKDELRPWYRAGEDRGRIYRIVRSGSPPRETLPLTDRSPRELVGLLASPNGWQRDVAQRLLVKMEEQATVEPLQKMATDSPQPLARLHALWTLAGLTSLSEATLEAALADGHPGVRRNAAKLASLVKINVNRLLPLVEDADAKVRLEVASTLGHYDEPAAADGLARLLINDDDPYIVAAAMSSLGSANIAAVLKSVTDSSRRPDETTWVELVEQAVAMGDPEAVARVIALVCSQPKAHFRFVGLARILDGLNSRKLSVDRLPDSVQDQISKTIETARTAAVKPTTLDKVRVASIQLLCREAPRQGQDFEIMERLLVPQSPSTLQRAIVAQLARRSDAQVAIVLLAGWRSHSPELRSQVLDALASRDTWAEVLRQHLERGAVQTHELDAPIRQRLLERTKNAARWKEALAITATTSRSDVLGRFESTLQLKGSRERGAVVFRKACLNCHQIKNEGHAVGPQLSSITNKTAEALLTSILDPNAAVDAKYFSYTIATKDGRSYSGRLETETGSSITLLAAEGKRNTILRRDIDALQASTKSLMPEGLEQGLTPQDIADLIQFVRDELR